MSKSNARATPQEADASRKRRLHQLLLLMASPLVLLGTVLVAKYRPDAAPFAAGGGMSYFVSIVVWHLWFVRCPRCSFPIGREMIKTSLDADACPQCGVDLTGVAPTDQ
jgi:hypothetical protein